MTRVPAILIAGKIEANGKPRARRDWRTSQDEFRLPSDDWGWGSAETLEGPTCGRSANRACQLASSWSRNDHEDGGPTIQLPAADARCTLRSLSCIQYMRLKRPARTVGVLVVAHRICVSSVWGISRCAKAATVHLIVAVIDVHSFGFTYPGAERPAVRDIAFSVESGEIFGFLGPSGAGKSTTQNVLIRLLDGYDGNVTVLGRDLRAGTEATTVELASRSRPRTTI